MTRVLITGGLGYLGGRIAADLAVRGGRTLRLTTRRPAGERPAWSRAFDVVVADFDSGDGVDAACRGVDAAVHLAAVNAPESAADPARAERVTVGGTRKLVEAAAKAGVKRLVYLSTAHVYGRPLAGRIDEATPPKPAHPYAVTHLAAEEIVLAAAKPTGVVLRVSNGVGAPADAGADCWMLVANDLCRQAATTDAVVLDGSGRELRDFVVAADVAGAVAHVLALPENRLGGRLFNVGGDRTLSVLALAEFIAGRAEKVLGRRPAVRRKQVAASGKPAVLDFRSDALRATGFRPTGAFEREIDDTLRFCRDAFAAA